MRTRLLNPTTRYQLVSNLPPRSFYGDDEFIAPIDSIDLDSVGALLPQLLEDRYVGNAAGWKCNPDSLEIGEFSAPLYYSSPVRGNYRVAPVFFDVGGQDLAHEKTPPPSRTMIGYILERLGD